jgi:hypothetical protein
MVPKKHNKREKIFSARADNDESWIPSKLLFIYREKAAIGKCVFRLVLLKKNCLLFSINYPLLFLEIIVVNIQSLSHFLHFE